MTFLQQTLGRNYKWWYLFWYNVILAFAGIRANFYMIFAMVSNTLAIVYIWKMSTDSTEIFTYLLIGRIYKAIWEGNLHVYFGDDIINGRITRVLIIPTNFMTSTTVQYLGKRFVRNIIEILGFGLGAVISIFLFVDIQPPSIYGIFLCLLFMPISYLVNYLCTYILGSVAFFLKDSREFVGVDISWQSIKSILYGLLIPLGKMPFSAFFIFLPFSYCVHHPMQIYLGKYNTNQILLTFAGGIVWCLVLWILARLVFKAGLKRNEAVGL